MGISSSKTKVEPWKQAQAPILGAVSSLQNTYNQNAPQTQALASTMNGYLSKMGEQAFGENPTLKAAQGYAGDVLGGKYLNGNPYLDNMAGLARVNAMDGINSAFGQNGMDFSSGHAKSLAKGMNEAELGLRYQDYGAERDRMGQMAGLSPSLIAAQYAPMEAYGNLATQAAELPFIGSKYLASGIGGLLGGYTTTKQSPSTFSNIMNGIGSAMQIASIASDVRLKTDIRRVGSTDGGLPVYTYRYGGEGPFHMGVMAQEVEQVQPEALGEQINGFMTVNYGEVQ